MPPPHPFRFAAQLSKATSAREWREAARKAARIFGYSTLSMPDHFFGDQRWRRYRP